METKTDKRIVSQREYVKAHLRQKGLSTTGYLVIVIFGSSIINIPILTFAAFIMTWLYFNPLFAFLLLPLGVALTIGTYHIAKKGEALVHQAAQMDTGVLLTRANTGNLPAPDSLVRASSEPLQVQEAVLLRAATEGQETPPEQLVRAVNGQE